MPSRSARHHCALITRLPAGRSPMARQVIAGRSADLFDRRVDQPAVAHLHRGDDLTAAGDGVDGSGRGGVPPDVDLTKRQAHGGAACGAVQSCRGTGGGCRTPPLEACHVPTVGWAGPTPVKAVIGCKDTHSVRTAPLSFKGGGPVVALGGGLSAGRLNAPNVGDGDRSVSKVTPSWASHPF